MEQKMSMAANGRKLLCKYAYSKKCELTKSKYEHFL